jgi:hypothetical protein
MIPLVLESLNDPFFYLGIVAALVVVLVPLVVAVRRMELSFEVVCEAKLLGVEDNGWMPTTAVDDDVEERMLFVIDLHDAGSGPTGRQGSTNITPAQEYRREVSFSFGEGAQVLEAGVLDEHPSGIGAKVRIDGTQGGEELVLEEDPSERSESIRLKAVVKNPTAEPESPWVGGGVRYDIRVKESTTGIRKIRRRWDSQKQLVYAFLAGFLGVVLDQSIVGWVGRLLMGDRTWHLGPQALLLGIQASFVGIAAVLLILALLKDKRSREIADQLGSSYPIVERKSKMGWP